MLLAIFCDFNCSDFRLFASYMAFCPSAEPIIYLVLTVKVARGLYLISMTLCKRKRSSINHTAYETGMLLVRHSSLLFFIWQAYFKTNEYRSGPVVYYHSLSLQFSAHLIMKIHSMDRQWHPRILGNFFYCFVLKEVYIAPKD